MTDECCPEFHLAEARLCFERADKIDSVEDAIGLMLDGLDHLLVYLEEHPKWLT